MLVLLLLYSVLSCFAVSYPLLDLLSQNSEFFVIRRADTTEIYLLVVSLILFIPLLLWGIDCIISLISQRLAFLFRFTSLSFLIAITTIIILNRVPIGPGVYAVIIAALIGSVISLAILRSEKLRTFVFWLSPILVLAPGSFFFNSNIRSLLKVQVEEGGSLTNKIKSAIPVVMVVLDEFPLWALLKGDLDIDKARFPNFASLASHSYWFKNATAVNQFTPLAVPAILSGQFPQNSSSLPTLSNYPGNIFTLLQYSHDMQVLEPITQLCPEKLCGSKSSKVGLKQSFNHLLIDLFAIYLRTVIPDDIDLGQPEIDGKWQDFWGDPSLEDWNMPDFSRDARVRGFEDYLTKLVKSDRASLYFSHHILPHMPLQFLPSGKAYTIKGTRGYFKNRWIDDQAAILDGLRQYLLQVGTVDTLIGKLFQRLKVLNIYDDALIIITADHGLSFQPNTYRRGDANHPSFYQDILSVPLFIKLPNQIQAVVSERNVEAIDILPTIADVLKLELPFKVDGQSVFQESAREKKRVLIGRIPGAKARASKDISEILAAGRAVEIDMPPNFPRASLDFKLKLPNYETPLANDPFYFGLNKELIDTKVSNYKVNPRSNLKVKLNEKRWQSSEKIIIKWSNNMSACPCRIQAQLSGDEQLISNTVGISINEIFKGFAKPYRGKRDAIEVEFFISEKALNEGENQVVFWQVTPNPSANDHILTEFQVLN